MKNIAILGSSGHSKVILEIAELDPDLMVIGFIGPSTGPENKILGYPILGGDEDIPTLLNEFNIDLLVVAIGDNFIRQKVAAKILSNNPDICFAKLIHPAASVANSAVIGEGTVVMAGAVVGASAQIGNHCILNTLSSIDHDSKMGNFSSLGPGAIVGGGCELLDLSVIGLGAKVIHNIHIGEHAVVGSGSLVLGNIEPYKVAFGSPAKIIRIREPGEKYL